MTDKAKPTNKTTNAPDMPLRDTVKESSIILLCFFLVIKHWWTSGMFRFVHCDINPASLIRMKLLFPHQRRDAHGLLIKQLNKELKSV